MCLAVVDQCKQDQAETLGIAKGVLNQNALEFLVKSDNAGCYHATLTIEKLTLT